MSQLLVIDSLKSFSLVPYFVKHVRISHPDCVVLEMAHLLNEQMEIIAFKCLTINFFVSAGHN